MTREELEKMFDKKFVNKIDKWFSDYDWTDRYTELKNWIDVKDIKIFIFETIIPELLKNVIPEENNWSYALYDSWWNDCINWNKWMKQKIKEKFWINL